MKVNFNNWEDNFEVYITLPKGDSIALKEPETGNTVAKNNGDMLVIVGGDLGMAEVEDENNSLVIDWKFLNTERS